MLISLDDIKKYKSITANLDSEKHLEPYIMEAQEFDLRPFLGDQLYKALVADYNDGGSPSLQTYVDLYSGSTYTWAGEKYTHEGIVPILVYFAYSRYILQSGSGATSTAYGFVIKESDYSQPVSRKQLQEMASQAKSGALVYQSRLEAFLRININDYPTWVGRNKHKSSIRISAVGGNSSRNYNSNLRRRICWCNDPYCMGC